MTAWRRRSCKIQGREALLISTRPTYALSFTLTSGSVRGDPARRHSHRIGTDASSPMRVSGLTQARAASVSIRCEGSRSRHKTLRVHETGELYG